MEIEDIKNSEDLQHAVQMPKLFLRPLGLWPVQSSNYPKILRLFLIGLCSFLLTFLFIPSVLYIFLIEKDFNIRLKLIGPLSFTTMNICKYTGLLRKGNLIRDCLSRMADDWNNLDNTAERDIMRSCAKTARKFTAVCALFMYCGGLPFTIVLPIVQDAIVIDNVTFRPFSYMGHFIFFNPHVSPNFEIVYSIHCLCGVVTYTITIGLCSIGIVFILHICGQMASLAWLMQNLADNFDNKALGKIVRKHNRALRFASSLENILTEMCAVEIIGCTFNMCMLGYYFITGYEESEYLPLIVFILLFTSFTFNIFIFCYMGDLLTERCGHFGKIVYTISWYKLSSKDAKNLLLMVFSTYRPVVLTAGKLVTLSLMNFTSVVKVSFSYLNMLRTITASSS